jgi:hypothetical protein
MAALVPIAARTSTNQEHLSLRFGAFLAYYTSKLTNLREKCVHCCVLSRIVHYILLRSKVMAYTLLAYTNGNVLYR